MTKKEKILFSYIANIIEDERPTDVFIETSQDISKLLKRIERNFRINIFIHHLKYHKNPSSQQQPPFYGLAS